MAKRDKLITVAKVNKHNTLEELILNEFSYKEVSKIPYHKRNVNYIENDAIALMQEKYSAEIDYAGYCEDGGNILSREEYPEKTAYMAVAAHCMVYEADYKKFIKSAKNSIQDNLKEQGKKDVEIEM